MLSSVIGWILIQCAITTVFAFASTGVSFGSGSGITSFGILRQSSPSQQQYPSSPLQLARGGGENGDDNLRTVLVTGGTGRALTIR